MTDTDRAYWLGVDRAPFSNVLDEIHDLYTRKNAEYGNAVEDTGLLGAVVALTGDVGRLRVLVIQDEGHGRYSADNARDKLLDITVQAVIGIMMLDNNNWEGKDSEDPIR